MLSKIKKIKAFTILELTIVITIIAILMAATMRFGGDRISLLKNKNIQEQFLDNFSSLQSKNSMTSYVNWEIYQELLVHFKVGEEKVFYEYYSNDTIFSGNTEIDWGNYVIEKILLNDSEVNNVIVSLTPYSLWCNIEDGQNSLKIKILVNNSKEYSFQLNPSTCRMKNISNW